MYLQISAQLVYPPFSSCFQLMSKPIQATYWTRILYNSTPRGSAEHWRESRNTAITIVGLHRASRYHTKRWRSINDQVCFQKLYQFSPLCRSRLHLRNCAFQVKAHRLLMSAETRLVEIVPGKQALGANILLYILLPLAGPEEFDLEASYFTFCKCLNSS